MNFIVAMAILAVAPSFAMAQEPDGLRREHEKMMRDLQERQDKERAELNRNFERRLAELDRKRPDENRDPRQGGDDVQRMVGRLAEVVERLQQEVANLRREVEELRRGNGEKRRENPRPIEPPRPERRDDRRDPQPEPRRNDERQPEPPKMDRRQAPPEPPTPPRQERRKKDYQQV